MTQHNDALPHIKTTETFVGLIVCVVILCMANY
jgi:hypothetical protein